jgi:hypothetical protein
MDALPIEFPEIKYADHHAFAANFQFTSKRPPVYVSSAASIPEPTLGVLAFVTAILLSRRLAEVSRKWTVLSER